jgi:hypothetical protein
MPFETKDLRHLGQLKLKALVADQKNGIAQRKSIHGSEEGARVLA